MYCKHCGKEIADDSKFCQHCGKSQDGSSKSLSNKPIWIIYLIWAVSNLYLLMGEKYDPSDYFFPSIFSDGSVPWNKDYYDYSEFIFYVFIIPSIIYIVYRRYPEQINKLINRILKN
jgi:hypothetical protein